MIRSHLHSALRAWPLLATAQAAALFLLPAATSQATVALVGVDSTAGANWRTGATLESDGQYGTAGYVVFGLNVDDGVYTQPFDVSSASIGNAYNLPSGVSISTLDTNIGMWSGNGNFGLIEHPVDGLPTSAPVLANSAGTRQFTISRAVSAGYRITFLTASGDNEGTEYSLTVNDGSGAAGSIFDHQDNGLAYHVFDVSAGTSDVVVDIASAVQNRSVSGIAFDLLPIPEPATGLLAGVALLGVLRRRRA